MNERELASRIAIRMYADEACRICGQILTVEDLSDAKFAGYSDDHKSRSAHGTCWRNLVDVVRKMQQAGILDRVIGEATS